MFEAFTDAVSGSPWTYVVIFAVAAIDAFFPLVPSETTVIAAGVLAGSGDLNILLVIAVAAAGAFAGDNLTYGVGRLFGDRLIAWSQRSPKRKRRFDWAERTLDERGGYLIVVARFIPGGRTVTMLVVGLLEMPWHRFARFDAVAAVFWASYAGLLGYLGGEVFEERPWLGLIAAFVIAFVITTGVEVYRHRRRQPQLES